jgi:hypothetical protein
LSGPKIRVGKVIGGGVYCYSDGSVFNCTINGNSAKQYGGGIYLNGGSVFDCIISGNSAGWGGGVCYVSDGSVSDCTISGNVSVRGGGAFSQSRGIFSGCIINGNTADESGGGMYCYYGGSLTNCLIYGMNSAKYGGGIFIEFYGKLYNCTIAGNNADESGGGIISSNGGTVVNTIIYDNTASVGNDNWRNYASKAEFSFSCTTPLSGLPNGYACISNDPLFVSTVPSAYDYHLQAGSPCINAGTNMEWMTTTKDLAGDPRIYDGTVDMGCYEDVPEPGIWILIIGLAGLGLKD